MTALRDAHLHLGAYGEALAALDLASCTSANDALERLAERAAIAEPNEWITAVGARIEGWSDRRWPTADELTAAAAGRHVVIRSFDIHAVCVSATLLDRLNLDRHAPDPPGGRLDRDPEGNPTGLLVESAVRLLDAILPAPTPEQMVERVRLAAADLAARGFSEVHDLWTDLPLARAIRTLEQRGQLPLRVGLAPLLDHAEACLADASFTPSDLVFRAGVKVFTDGTLNSRTASMLEPYADPHPDHPRGMTLMDEPAIERAVRLAGAAGLPLIAHAIGDAAVRACLNAIERAAPAIRGQRIEHAQFIDEADIPRFAQLGVIASVQPCHLLPDIEALHRLTPQRRHRAFPLRDLVDAAASAGHDPARLIWMGSDAPVVPPRPEDNRQAAVHRARPGGAPVAPEQAITDEEWRALSRAPVRSTS